MKVMLKELGEIITGNTPSKQIEEFWNAEDICFIKPDVIADSGVNEISESNEYISEEARKKARVVSKDAIFVTCIGSIGKIGIAKDGEYAFNQQINAIIPNEKVHPKYLAYNLLFNKERLIGMANAPVVPIINKSQFGEFTLNIEIDSDKQSEIVKVLDKLMDIIKHRENELFALDALIKARFVEMFGDPNVEFKYESHKFKEYAFDMTKGPFGSDMKKDLYVPKGEDTYKVYIQINAIQGNQNLGDYYISKEYFKQKISRFEVHPGDFIITCDGTLGKHLKLDENMEKGVISPSLLRLTLDESKMTQEYFECMWDMYMLLLMKKEARNACLVHLPSAKVIGEVDIPVAPFELQKEFSDFVKQVDKSKVAIQKIHKKGYNCL